MPISMAQLAILAEKYGFDVDDARLTIGMPPTSARGRPATAAPVVQKKPGRPAKTVAVPIKAPSLLAGFYTQGCCNSTTSSVVEKPAPKKRGPSGYNLYMAEVRSRVVQDLENSLKPREKMAKGAVVKEIGKRWKMLPESSRAIWNAKAAGGA
jgi:hypothetical protein